MSESLENLIGAHTHGSIAEGSTLVNAGDWHCDKWGCLILLNILRCRPNCKASVLEVTGVRRIFLISLRQLADGEELTFAADSLM